MGHWQVLALKAAELWSENAQDMIYQNQSNLVIMKVQDFTSTRIFLTVLSSWHLEEQSETNLAIS
jgi:hypothetical protein